MTQPLITAKALRAAKCRQLAKSSSSTFIPSRVVVVASKVKLEVPPPAEGVGLPWTTFTPKPELMEVKVEEPPVTAASGVVAQASKKRPWPKESTRVPFSAFSGLTRPRGTSWPRLMRKVS